jgi:hypothetical protein
MLILDIRYYEHGANYPSTLGKEFVFSVDTESIGARIARKLREFGFALEAYDHLYIVFTGKIPENEIKAWSRIIDPRIRCIDYGASITAVGQMSAEKQFEFLYEATFDVLNFLIGKEKGNRQLITKAFEDIHKYNRKLEILHKQKETASYSLTVSYQIKPENEKSIGWVLYIDKKTSLSGKIPFIELEHYQDIFFLVSSISVSKGFIHLKPRNSFRAEIWNKRYSVPIEIPLERLKTA